MNLSFLPIHVRWILESDPGPQGGNASFGDLEPQPLVIPPEIGGGHFEVLQLPFGTSLIHGVHHFQPAAEGRLISLGEFEIDHGSPSFIVQTMRGGRACQQEMTPPMSLLFEDGKDLFGHIQKRHGFPWIDGSSNSEMTSLCMSVDVLKSFLGIPEAELLLSTLGLDAYPNFVVRSMPRSLGTLLHSAMSNQFRGQARKLCAQAKALEYLAGLSGYLHTDLQQAHIAQVKEQARDLHAHLLSLGGKLPTLEALAQQFNTPARRLNDEFKSEYGESIYTFITNHRLDQAREVMLRTDAPMKVLASRLGYSHVNNFINAFKRRFGVTPGSLRRTGAKG